MQNAWATVCVILLFFLRHSKNDETTEENVKKEEKSATEHKKETWIILSIIVIIVKMCVHANFYKQYMLFPHTSHFFVETEKKYIKESTKQE